MAWIESHQALREHPKVFDLMASMGWDLDTTLGKLHRFWWWCVDYCEDGDLQRHNDNRIAAAVGVLPGDPAKRFVEAMVAARWLDRDPYFRVHDWWNYAGPWLQAKYKRSNEKWERVRTLYSCNGDVTVTQQLRNRIPTNQPTLTNQPKDIKDGQPQTAALDLFMSHFTQALRKKAGVPADQQAKEYERKLTKKAYGLVVGYLKSHPDQGESLAQEFDFLQQGMKCDWYLGSLSRIVKDRVHQELKAMSEAIGK